MHIIYDAIIYSLQKQGGITRYAHELMRGVSASHDTTVLLHKKRFSEPPQDAKLDRQECTPFSIPFDNTFLKYILYPVDHFFTELFLRKQKYKKAIFHSTYFSHYFSLRIPQIITVHDMIHELSLVPQTLKDKIFVRRKKHAIKKAHHIICISKTTAEDLKRIYHISEEKISVVYNGISDVFTEDQSEADIESFKKENRIKKPFLLFVGVRTGYKNFKTFINAYAKWKQEEVDVVIVGGGDLCVSEKAYIRALGIEERVHYVGALEDKELACAYRACAAFVFSTLYEGFGMPLLEASASGARVLASDIPVFREIAGDALTYFDPKNTESIIAAFEKALTPLSEEEKAHITKRAKTYTWKKTAEKTISVYEKLLGI